MKYYPTIVIILLIFFANEAYSENFREKFRDLADKNDTTGQLEILKKWERTNPDDPEMYVAYFNYYFAMGRKEYIQVDTEEPEDGTYIPFRDTASNEVAGYIYSVFHYDTSIVNRGFEYISSGIEKFPDRLDMRFGKIYTYGEIEDYDNFTNEIVNTIEYGAGIDNKWKWTDNEPVEDPKQSMLGSIQDYQLQLFNTGNDSLLENLIRIANTILKHYPEHIESLSNISVAHLIRQEYDEALKILLKAEKIAPDDFIILNNIAFAYRQKKDFENAIKYYKLASKYGDDDVKEQAKKRN